MVRGEGCCRCALMANEDRDNGTQIERKVAIERLKIGEERGNTRFESQACHGEGAVLARAGK